MQKFETDYDYENDNLIIFKKGRKSSGNVEIGEIVLDFYKGELIAIEINNASKFLNTPKYMLKKIVKSKFDATKKNNWLFIKTMLLINKEEISYDFSVPDIIESSPAVAHC